MATRARATVEGLLLLVGIVVVVVLAVGWERLVYLGGDHEVWLYSHHGRRILKPSLVLLSATPGQPPDFESRRIGSLIQIPAKLATEGREILACGPGCGLLHGKFDGEHRVTLPPPIRATMRVPGEFELPSGERGIELRFSATGVRPEVAFAVAGAAVASDHWDRPESPVWDERIWLDPGTRSVSVLLPCTGTWRVDWSQTDRRPDGKAPSFSIAYGRGEVLVTVGAEGEEHLLTIAPEDLDPRR